jgi:hypothetical protein
MKAEHRIVHFENALKILGMMSDPKKPWYDQKVANNTTVRQLQARKDEIIAYINATFEHEEGKTAGWINPYTAK